MTLPISKVSTIIRDVFLSSLGWGLLSGAQTPVAPTVSLSPGDNIQAAVAAAPAGTTFILHAGVYRMQSVQPKNGDIFNGQGKVDLIGSQVLSFKAAPGHSGLWAANATSNKINHGGCQSAFPLCGYTQDLFIDNVLQPPASSLEGLKPGTWYFDRTNNAVYVPASPTGHAAELGMQQYAFYGSAANVQISNLTVEKYAAMAQNGAIGGNASGTCWVVNKVESRWNHGRGISLGSGSTISNSFIHLSRAE